MHCNIGIPDHISFIYYNSYAYIQFFRLLEDNAMKHDLLEAVPAKTAAGFNHFLELGLAPTYGMNACQ